eukprot:366529-Chlamydomonas_euryale.AAC.17
MSVLGSGLLGDRSSVRRIVPSCVEWPYCDGQAHGATAFVQHLCWACRALMRRVAIARLAGARRNTHASCVPSAKLHATFQATVPSDSSKRQFPSDTF